MPLARAPLLAPRGGAEPPELRYRRCQEYCGSGGGRAGAVAQRGRGMHGGAIRHCVVRAIF